MIRHGNFILKDPLVHVDYLLLFSMSCESKLNIFGFWTVGRKKTSHLKMSHWALGNRNLFSNHLTDQM